MGNIMGSNSTDEQILDALQKPNRLVIDCRSKGEFGSGDAFEGAVNIPVDSIEARLAEIGDNERTVITYCAAGVRAARAANILKNGGYVNAFSTTNAGHLREIAQKIPK
jgi:phage shock protein E